MRRILITCICLVAVLALSCSSNVETGDKVAVTITDRDTQLIGGDAHVEKYYKGATAEITLLIKNNCNYDITPTIYPRFNVDPELYSIAKGGGYVKTPTYYRDWLEIPKCGVIEAMSAKSYNLVLNIPANAKEEIPAKWAFRVGVAPNGRWQNATSFWWRVDMRS